ncbi:MAG: peptidyl-prolyl cis-trans isomerase [Myxococcales bacterium]|nr:peptidyl-prolyl cis-trans isomerase [Myxococcales bacterium]
MRPWLPILCLTSSALASTVAAVGCGSKDEPTSPVADDDGEWPRHGLTREQAAQTLAKVGDTTITVGELAEALADQSPYLRARYNSPERRREFLDNLIRFELLAQEAERRGLHELPEVQRTRKQLMIQQMLKTRIEDAIQLSDVTDEEIRAHYEANRDEFNKPEQVRASHILMRDEAAARRVLREILGAPEDMLRFRQLAERHDEDPETSRGSRRGDLRFFSRDGTREDEAPVPREVAEAAFTIQDIGAVHPELVRSSAGFHIVKLTGRRAALSRSLEESRRAIQNRLWREKRERAVEELVERLRREAEIRTNEDALAAVRIDLSHAGVPEVPTSADELEVPEGAGAAADAEEEER